MKVLSEGRLSMETVISQSPGNIISDMAGETVMMSIDNGKYYNLGEIGGHIWKCIETPISVNKLISKLTDEFDVENGQCKKELIPFLEMLINEKLIMVEGVL
ncbi:lasso peptide biosynthesis PqqD family chaperone [Bacillus salipaludis]|uniref:lasso peptide biosynthesis PqqD family chaperone n=1 Tax=Bacillus salipaludis TaxID=2547811 RepID=UPI003D1B12DA